MASATQKSECVDMPERCIRTAMNTSFQTTGSKGLSDVEVVGLWLLRQRSWATRSVYRRDMARLTTCSDETLAETDPLDLEPFAPACGRRWRNPSPRRRRADSNPRQRRAHARRFPSCGVWGQFAPLRATASLGAPVFASRHRSVAATSRYLHARPSESSAVFFFL
jgi:hypothetical protein